MFLLYDILLTIGAVFLLPLILPLVASSRKRRKTVRQRLALVPRPYRHPATGPGVSGRPVWVHALSVGEVLSAVPLVEAMKNAGSGRPILFSASTLTGYEIARDRLKDHVRSVGYYPYDFSFSVRRALDAANPAAVVIVESDIWPNFLHALKQRGVPAILVNARLSARSFRGFRRIAPLSGAMFGLLSEICTQSAADAGRFTQLGVSPDRITVTGNLKFDQGTVVLPQSASETMAVLQAHLLHRPVWVAGSTHTGEEQVLCEAFRLLKDDIPDLILVIAPRNPDRAPIVRKIFRKEGFSTAALQTVASGARHALPEVVVADTMGMLRSLYAVSTIAFVGGSLVKEGGHNPLEPAAFSKPVLFGPDMSDFAEIAALLMAGGAAVQVEDAVSLAESASALLKHPGKRRRMGNMARSVYQTNGGAVGKTMKIVGKYMERP